MTPKEKALELIEKFYQNAPDTFGTGKAFGHGQSCALIAAGEILQLMLIESGESSHKYW